MAGRRSLTPLEERMLIAVTRKMTPRDGCLVTCQWMTGFRISEVLRITVGTVLKGGEVVPKIGLAPRQMKGGYGKTRWVPVVPELKRAIARQLSWLRLRYELTPDMPLFPSRESGEGRNLKPLSRDMARHIIKGAFAKAEIEDDGRLGTHSLRKTWARNVYRSSGNDILLLSAALNHQSVVTTQRYLSVDDDELMTAMRECDFTRGLRKKPVVVLLPADPLKKGEAA